MKTRQSFLLSIAALGFIALPSSVSASNPDIYFYPSSGWNTSSTQNAGQTVCSTAAKFNNGFIVSFNGSDKWVESLNVDLQQDALEQGQTYPVELSVPGQTAKTVTGHATSNNNVMIKMAGNKELYQMIRNSSVFDFNIEDNDFRFYMVGFSKTADSFEKCMAAGTTETVVASADNSLSVGSKNIENEALKMENAESEALTTPPKPVKHASLEKKKIVPKVKQPKPEPSIDMLPVPGMQSDLTEKVVETPAAVPVTPEVQKKNIKSEVKVQKTKRSLEADLTDVKQTKRKSPRKDVAAVSKTDSTEIKRLKRIIQDLQEENELLNSEVSDISTESREEKISIETRNWNLERATMRFHEAERQLKRLGQQVQQERSKCRLEKDELEAMLFDPQVTEAQQSARLADLTRQLEETQKQLESERRTYEARIQALQDRL